MNFFGIICVIMLVIGLGANILSWYLEKRYKKKMNSISEDLKLGK